ncbi:MAG TPA: hypothetical protein VFT21_02995 [Gemmatimonadaceae bacterium]|nr:hypothetical protein [Gemmatimonadaceae bacterium]
MTTSELTPKQMVRNIESALIAHLAMRIDHRKISVATTSETKPKLLEPEVKAAPPPVAQASEGQQTPASAPRTGPFARRLYFEDVEVRGSRSKGLSCRVTLRKGNSSFIGEALGIEGDRSRVELAARATLLAIADADNREGQLGVQGVKVFDAFDRTFVFVAVSVRSGRDNKVLTGSVEMRESAESAGVLAVLDATNRWIEHN